MAALVDVAMKHV